jgi:putative hydrolase of the HAD superfamily
MRVRDIEPVMACAPETDGLTLSGSQIERSHIDWSHIDTWVFDLDNTLYPPHSKLWPQIDLRITLYLCNLFGLDGLSARALQKHYYYRYGTTLNGLMAENGIDPYPYLDFAHDIDLATLEPDPVLVQAIDALPGRKLIFTSGSKRHAANVTGRLGFENHFEGVFDIVDADFVPKPAASTYERFITSHGVDPRRAVMFEDIAKNLLVPDQMGMRTVLVLPKEPDPYREQHEQQPQAEPHIHHQTTDLGAFLQNLSKALDLSKDLG